MENMTKLFHGIVQKVLATDPARGPTSARVEMRIRYLHRLRPSPWSAFVLWSDPTAWPTQRLISRRRPESRDPGLCPRYCSTAPRQHCRTEIAATLYLASAFAHSGQTASRTAPAARPASIHRHPMQYPPLMASHPQVAGRKAQIPAGSGIIQTSSHP